MARQIELRNWNGTELVDRTQIVFDGVRLPPVVVMRLRLFVLDPMGYYTECPYVEAIPSIDLANVA